MTTNKLTGTNTRGLAKPPDLLYGLQQVSSSTRKVKSKSLNDKSSVLHKALEAEAPPILSSSFQEERVLQFSEQKKTKRKRKASFKRQLVDSSSSLLKDNEQISMTIHQMEEAFEALLQAAPSPSTMQDTKQELFLSANSIYLFLYDRLLDVTLDIGESMEAQLERLNLVRITKLMLKLVLNNFIDLIDDHSGLELLKNHSEPILNFGKNMNGDLNLSTAINFELLLSVVGEDCQTDREKLLHTIFGNMKKSGLVATFRLGPEIAGIDLFIFAFYVAEHLFYAKDHHLESFADELLQCIRWFEDMTCIEGDSFSGTKVLDDLHASKDIFGNSNRSVNIKFRDWETGVELSLNACMMLVQSMLLFHCDENKRHEAILITLHALEIDNQNIYALLMLYYFTSEGHTNQLLDAIGDNDTTSLLTMKPIHIVFQIETIIKQHGLGEHPRFFPLLDLKTHALLIDEDSSEL